MHHFICWTLFISGINRSWLYKGLSDSQRQPNSDLAQWQSMRLMIWRLWVQPPLGAFFDEIYFVLCNFRCQIIWQKRVSWKTHNSQSPVRSYSLICQNTDLVILQKRKPGKATSWWNQRYPGLFFFFFCLRKCWKWFRLCISVASVAFLIWYSIRKKDEASW